MSTVLVRAIPFQHQAHWHHSCATLRLSSIQRGAHKKKIRGYILLRRMFMALVKLDSRTRFRVGEAAYYGCSQEGAVFEAAADINILELQCLGHQGTNSMWNQ